MPQTFISLTEKHQDLWPVLHALALGGKCPEVNKRPFQKYSSFPTRLIISNNSFSIHRVSLYWLYGRGVSTTVGPLLV